MDKAVPSGTDAVLPSVVMGVGAIAWTLGSALVPRAGYSLPLVVAPLAAGVVLGLMNSYPALFALSGFVAITAAWTVSRARSAELLYQNDI